MVLPVGSPIIVSMRDGEGAGGIIIDSYEEVHNYDRRRKEKKCAEMGFRNTDLSD